MRQKFRQLTFVRVSDTKEPGMAHFEYDFDGIVEGTFSQQHGGKDIDSYSVFKLENGKVVNCLAWYKEAQLTALPEQDRDRAEELIEEYHFREDEDDDDEPEPVSIEDVRRYQAAMRESDETGLFEGLRRIPQEDSDAAHG